MGWECVRHAYLPGTERAQALLASCQGSPTPRYLVADAKLSSDDKAANLKKLGFITRIPGPLKLGPQVVRQALTGNPWQRFDETTPYQPSELGPSGMAQRWLVVWSQASLERAQGRVHPAAQREAEAMHKQLLHLQAQRFETPSQAQEA